MADVVDQGESLGQFGIESEIGGEGSSDLGHFKCVGEAAAEMIGDCIGGQAGEDLGLAGEAAKRTRMQNARSIAREGRAVGVGRLAIGAKYHRIVGRAGNSKAERQRKRRSR